MVRRTFRYLTLFVLLFVFSSMPVFAAVEGEECTSAQYDLETCDAGLVCRYGYCIDTDRSEVDSSCIDRLFSNCSGGLECTNTDPVTGVGTCSIPEGGGELGEGANCVDPRYTSDPTLLCQPIYRCLNGNCVVWGLGEEGNACSGNSCGECLSCEDTGGDYDVCVYEAGGNILAGEVCPYAGIPSTNPDLQCQCGLTCYAGPLMTGGRCVPTPGEAGDLCVTPVNTCGADLECVNLVDHVGTCVSDEEWERWDYEDFIELIKLFLKITYYAALGIGLSAFALAGYKIMTSKGDPRKAAEGKEEITSATQGILFFALAAIILGIVIKLLLGEDIL